MTRRASWPVALFMASSPAAGLVFHADPAYAGKARSGPAVAPPANKNGASPVVAVEQPTGDFDHTPAAEQKANTPLPVFARYEGESLSRVVLKFKGPGTPDWRRIDLQRMAGGWGGLVPCGEVTVGVLYYYLQGFDAEGDSVAGSGDPKHPFSVPIKAEIEGEGPRLPGRSLPESCDEATSEEAPPPRHQESADEPAFASWWFGISGAVDFVSLPGGSDVCKLLPSAVPASSSGYYCTNPDGTDFPSRSSATQNSSLVAGQAGNVAGGAHPGDVRAMLAVDYAISSSLLAGLRVGTVGNGYPGSAAVRDGHAFSAHVHVEIRGTYLFGPDPLANLGFSPMVFVAAGASEFDGHATTVVSQKDIAGQQPVIAWLTSGPWFLALGGGMRYQFSRRAAFTAAIRMNAAFGGVGALLTYGPELGFQYGF